MDTDERRGEENSRDSASRSGSMDSTNGTVPIESFNGSVNMDEDKGRFGNDVQSGRVHKGGRKLIYATLEERKERNRQAQATFRERRIVYVAQLEKTIQEQRDELRRLQNACSSATDERLNLKYKNSLLERILLEKGIEVRAELDADILVRLPPKKVRKERQPSIRRSKQTTSCRKHSYITPEPTALLETCSCHPTVSHVKNSSNFQNIANYSKQHVTESKLPIPPNTVRWQQTHGAQNMGSQNYERNIIGRGSSVSHLGPDTQYHPYQQPRYQIPMPSSSSDPRSNSSGVPRPLITDFGPRGHLEHLDPEWSSSSMTMLRYPEPDNHEYNRDEDDDDDDDDNRDNHSGDAEADQYAPDRFEVTTATHSSPISTVRTPPDFSTVAHMQLQQQQQQQFGKQLDCSVSAPRFDLVDAGIESALHAYHAGFDVVQDPFGLDASLFSI